jgi:hypothetical protein
MPKINVTRLTSIPVVTIRHQTDIDITRKRKNLTDPVWILISNKIILVHQSRPARLDIIIRTAISAIREYSVGDQTYIDKLPTLLECLLKGKLIQDVAKAIAQKILDGQWSE